MTAPRDFDRLLGDWLEESPPGTPAEVMTTVAAALPSIPQRGARRIPWRIPPVNGSPWLARAAAIAVVAVLVGTVWFTARQGGAPPGAAGASPTATSPDRSPTGPSPSPSPQTIATSPAPFTEIAPGAFVDIPDWPLSDRTSPPRVWTGTELIVWGDGSIWAGSADGAAFDPSNGTWRVIAEAPIGPRSEPAVAWTGTEMVIWGGRIENTFYYDGAAYNPATDTWRLLPSSSPFFGKDPRMVWTGDEVVVLGVAGDSETTGEYIPAAAYDPVTDSWRSLANAPASVWLQGSNVWWTGDSIVVATVYGFGGGQTKPMAGRIARYDVAADAWTVADIGASSAVVGVTGSDGHVTTFLNLPSESGAPVQLIDSAGRLIDELPAFPGDPDVFDKLVGANGLWVGDEAIFEIWKVGSEVEPEQIWALNPGTQTWRRLDADTAFPRIDGSAVAAGDLLWMWNRPGDVYRGTPRACCVAPPGSGGSIYRAGTPGPSEVP